MESRLEHSHLQLNSNTAKAIYAEDLKANFSSPTFVRWNESTLNTPYKDGKTTASLGWAIAYGSDMKTILAGAMGANTLWIRTITSSSGTNWTAI